MARARVLVVNDAIIMREQIKDALDENQFEVIGEAANGVEAVERFGELRPDVTIMDILMPLSNGVEATRKIKALKKDAIVIMCGALGQEAEIRGALEAGATDFFLVPFDPDDIGRIVHAALGR